MKLRTELREQSPLTCDFDALKHDAAAAHALMRAIESHCGRNTDYMVLARADEIMAGWGFDTGEDA